MFKATDNKKKPVKSGSGMLNSIVDGTQVKGDLTCESDIRIDGKLVGSLKCEGKLIIGESGIIEGDVHCENAVIQGSFQGQLVVANTLDVKESGKINGEIKTEKLIVEAGAVFNVRCQMGDMAFGAPPEPFIEKAGGKA